VRVFAKYIPKGEILESIAASYEETELKEFVVY